jgi:hypothetical protein
MPVMRRLVSGLIFRDDFNRPNGALGALWVDQSAGRLGISGNKAQNLVTLITKDRAYPVGVAHIPFCVVQGTITTPAGVSYSGLLAARYNPITGRGLGISPPRSGVGTGSLVAWRIGGSGTGNDTDLASTQSLYPGVLRTGVYICKLIDSDTIRRCWVNGALVFTETTVTASEGSATHSRVGSSGTLAFGWIEQGTTTYDDLAVYSSNTVTVSNVPTGYSVRVGAITVLAVAGIASLDLSGTICPITSIELLNASNVVVETLDPEGGVWGGDSYIVNTPPAAPTVSISDSGYGSGIAAISINAVADADGGTHQGRIFIVLGSDPETLLFDSGWLSAPIAPFEVIDLPVDEPLVAWGIYRDEYEEGLEGLSSTVTLPMWRTCEAVADVDWTECEASTETIWEDCD